ncbi:MAG: DEAD/DEAH box helicase family protein, partial [Legionellaceae bacterium]|nr:DEAD/DEAH box helicase family protein [Legionellaceae bacterium]
MRPIIILSTEIAIAAEAEPFNKALSQLLKELKEGALAPGRNKEPLRGEMANKEKIYSLRLNSCDRVIAIDRENKGKPYTILLSMGKHDGAGAYGSKYLKRKDALTNFLTKYQPQIDSLVAESTESTIVALKDPRAMLSEAPEYVDPTADGIAGAGLPVAEASEATEKWRYNKRSITPTATQQECLDRLLQGLKSDGPFAALVAGAPGAGKTLLAFQLLEQLLNKVWYITESDTLRTTIEEFWQASPCYQEQKYKVDFLNYRDIALRVDSTLIDLNAVDDSDINIFFERAKTRHVQHSILKEVTMEQFRQECYVMASCDSLEAYQSMGRKHSQFHAAPLELKSLLWALYESYSKGLVDTSKYHPKLRRLAPEEASTVCEDVIIIVDEACDLSLVQLQNLTRLGAKIVYFGDHNQDAIFNSNLISYIDQQIGISYKGSDQRYVTLLDVSYRCSPEVATVASNALALTNRLQKQHLSGLVQTSISSGLDVTGNIRCVKSIEAEITGAFRESANTAIIYMDGDDAAKVDAEGIFGENSTYSISEIKGLEFKRIILWNVISNATASGIDKQLKLSKKKPKSELSIDTLAKQLKFLFIAITRAEVELVIRQSSLNHPSVNAVYSNITSGIAASQYYLDLEDPDMSNEEQWLNLADKLYKTAEHINRASRIYADQIRKLFDEGEPGSAFN